MKIIRFLTLITIYATISCTLYGAQEKQYRGKIPTQQEAQKINAELEKQSTTVYEKIPTSEKSVYDKIPLEKPYAKTPASSPSSRNEYAKTPIAVKDPVVYNIPRPEKEECIYNNIGNAGPSNAPNAPASKVQNVVLKSITIQNNTGKKVYVEIALRKKMFSKIYIVEDSSQKEAQIIPGLGIFTVNVYTDAKQIPMKKTIISKEFDPVSTNKILINKSGIEFQK
ncbi:MAG: hypothetical protein AB7R69_06155 [Candidatus Babeliales bacterium]